MTNTTSRLPLAFALALASLSCTPMTTPLDGGDADAGAAAPPSASEYCEHIEPFFCDFYLRCGRMAGVTTTEECRAVFQEQCNARYEPRYAALERASLLRLDADGIEACRAHLADVPCEEQIRDLDGPCGAMWIGAQAEGGACGFDVESLVCAPGSECTLGLDFCGECRPLQGEGEPCGDAAEESVTCGTNASCEDGRCVARVAVGDPCTPDDRCVIGASCDETLDLCVGPTYVGLGESCDQTRRCPYKSHCAGVCVEDVMLEESCATTTCASGWCGADDVCQALLPAGGTCASSAQCSSGLCLDGVCRDLPGPCFD